MNRAPALLLLALLASGCQKRVQEQSPAPLAAAVRPIAPPAPPPPPAPAKDSGVWVESDSYDFKLISSARCAGKLALRVRVRSKVKALFIGPRDATLFDGNQRYEALRTADQAGCQPALPTGHLQRDKESEGYLVFDIAHSAQKPILEFAPTRWGGAGAVRVAVAD